MRVLPRMRLYVYIHRGGLDVSLPTHICTPHLSRGGWITFRRGRSFLCREENTQSGRERGKRHSIDSERERGASGGGAGGGSSSGCSITEG